MTAASRATQYFAEKSGETRGDWWGAERRHVVMYFRQARSNSQKSGYAHRAQYKYCVFLPAASLAHINPALAKVEFLAKDNAQHTHTK